MSWLLFFMFANAIIFVFGFARYGLGRIAYPLTILVILAITGNMNYAKVMSEQILQWLGVHYTTFDGTLWQLWFYVPGPLAFGLSIWLALEIGHRFPGPVPPPLCRKCGYNLTGNVSGVCPECGTPIPSKPVETGPSRPGDSDASKDSTEGLE